MSIRTALQDVTEGFQNYEFWVTFGANEIRKKYRRSKLGQFWITLSVAIFVFAIGSLYKNLFNIEGDFYMAYLAVGYILWQFIAGVLNKSGSILTKSNKFMQQRNWPVSSFILWFLYSELLILLHNSIIIIPIFIYWNMLPSTSGIALSVLGFILTITTVFFISMTISIVALRYRDLQPIIKSLVRMAFFVTPIIWIERDLGHAGNLITSINPFGYFLRIVRDPLIGFPMNPFDWLVAGALLIACALLALFLLARTKHHLAFWL